MKNLPPFSDIVLTEKDMYAVGMANWEELSHWLRPLFRQDLIASRRVAARYKNPDLVINEHGVLGHEYQITPKGWQEIEQYHRAIHSNSVFLAMDFNHPLKTEIQKAVEDALEASGFDRDATVNSKEYQGGITDEIIARIRQARFLIAECTPFKDAYDVEMERKIQNAGVYFEAGWAEGLGRPVIYCVREENVGDLHFDTRHFNHIVWTDYSDLTKKLKNRIQAVIGKE